MKKVVVITGALGGMGSAACRLLQSQDFFVIGIDNSVGGQQLGIDVITVSSVMKEPGTVFPLHRDNFNNPLWDQTRVDQLVRALIFPEDCKIGHIIQYIEDRECRTRANWVAGDGFMWDNQVPHLTVNAGMQPNYTMQITGFLKK